MKQKSFEESMIGVSPFLTLLSSGAAHYGIALDTPLLSLFRTYFDLLSEWNTRMNLVSDRDMGRFVEYHLLDSLKVASCFDFSPVRTLLDFGSGAGLPGIPLAIAFPPVSVTLLDSREKKVRFLDDCILRLPLRNATAVRSRIEDLPSAYNGSFDAVITRATVSLAEFYHLSIRLIGPGGSLIAIKGDAIDPEFQTLISSVDSRFFHIRRVTPVTVPGVRTGQVVIISRIPVFNNAAGHG